MLKKVKKCKAPEGQTNASQATAGFISFQLLVLHNRDPYQGVNNSPTHSLQTCSTQGLAQRKFTNNGRCWCLSKPGTLPDQGATSDLSVTDKVSPVQPCISYGHRARQKRKIQSWWGGGGGGVGEKKRLTGYRD